MAGTPAAIGDDGRSTLHDRLPVRVGHVGHQHVARLDLIHLLGREHQLHRTTADTLADGPASHQGAPLLLEVEALQLAALQLGNHGFRPRLDDVELAVVAIQRPLDIHRASVVLLDGHGLARQRHDLIVVDTEAAAILQRHVDGGHRLARAGVFAIDHLDQLGAEVAAQYCRAPGRQGRLVDVEFVGVDRTLHHRLAQAPGGGDKHRIGIARLGIKGEHDAGSAGFRAHHLLDAGR